MRALRVLLLLLLLCGARAAVAAPQLVRAGHAGRVTVLAEPGLEDTARDLAASAESELTAIADDLVDLPTPNHIEIRLVADAKDLAAVAPAGRGAPAYAIGVAYPDLSIIGIATRRNGQVADAETTLRHELAHVALGAALGDHAPHWLHEGFAYQHSAEWSWERTETLAGMAWFGGIVPLDELDASFPAEEIAANRAYAESYDFVGFLSRRGRWEDTADDGDRWPFRRFLSEVGHGATLDTAAIHAFGKPLHQLFDEWRESLSGRYMLAPIGLLGLLVWVCCAILHALAWRRRKKQNKLRLAQWDIEEGLRDDEVRSSRVIVPPYVPWPGEDPLSTEPDDDDGPNGPRLMN